MNSEERRARDREIYESQEWAYQRGVARNRWLWHDGAPLREVLKRRDKATGRALEKFPLRVNWVAMTSYIHRDVARGLPASYDLVVRSVVDRSCSLGEQAPFFEKLLNELIWIPSYGAVVQSDALLHMNIYGYAVLRLHYEPWNADLPVRLAVRLVKDPSAVYFVNDPDDPYRPLEAWYGFEMDAQAAVAKYGITIPDDTVQKVLYMERWTRTEWEVSVHGQIPTMVWGEHKWQLKGENPFGVVPFYYVPHTLDGERETGDSVERLTQAFNARVTNIMDASRAIAGLYIGHDIAAFDMKPLVVDGIVIGHVLDIGRTRNISGAQPPTIEPIQAADVPDTYSELPKMLQDIYMLTGRLSPSIFGQDDTASGRITGPAIANRMLSSLTHATTERISLSRAMAQIGCDAIRISVRFLRDIVDVEIPDADVSEVRVNMQWPSSVPTDSLEERRIALQEYSEGAASPERYLASRGVSDPASEIEAIYEHQTMMAKIEAEAKNAQNKSGDTKDGRQQDG